MDSMALLLGASCFSLCLFYFTRQRIGIVIDGLAIKAKRARKAAVLKPSDKKQSPRELTSVFPPHRRTALGDLEPNALSGSGPSASELSRRPPEYKQLRLSATVPCDADYKPDSTTPTGFTIEEIRRLGNFPDYAALSGSPLPKPYRVFDIAKALPRPYRPYRWPYHQTMCKYAWFALRRPQLTLQSIV